MGRQNTLMQRITSRVATPSSMRQTASACCVGGISSTFTVWAAPSYTLSRQLSKREKMAPAPLRAGEDAVRRS